MHFYAKDVKKNKEHSAQIRQKMKIPVSDCHGDHNDEGVNHGTGSDQSPGKTTNSGDYKETGKEESGCKLGSNQFLFPVANIAQSTVQSTAYSKEDRGCQLRRSVDFTPVTTGNVI